jgi:RNA polymerase sigma-70 factor (ECF subfamily)
LQTSEANARQLLSRARKQVRSQRRTSIPATKHRALLDAFIGAARAGEVASLERLFAADVVSCSDGGGVAARAARVPVAGRARVARFVASFADTWWADTTLRWIEANGRPAVLVLRDGGLIAFVTISVSTDGIEELFWVMNPPKLSTLTA